MNEPYKTTERYVIERRNLSAKYLGSREWKSFEYQPDGRIAVWAGTSNFKTLADAKKVYTKLMKQPPHWEYRIILEQRTYTLIEL